MSIDVQEKSLDGTIRVLRGVRFKNTGRTPVKLSIPRESQVPIGKNEKGEMKYANRSYELAIQPGEVAAVPEDMANSIQECRCILCGLPWRFGQHGPGNGKAKTVCVDPSHPRVVRSGLAPFLQVVGDDDRVIPPPPTLESNLLAVAETAVAEGDLHQRVMARIGQRGDAR